MTSFIEEYESVRGFDVDAEIEAINNMRKAHEAEQKRKEDEERAAYMEREIRKFEAEYGPLDRTGDLSEDYYMMCRESIAISKAIEEANKPKPVVAASPAPAKPAYKPRRFEEVEAGSLAGYKPQVNKKDLKAQRAVEAELVGNFAGQNDSEGYVSKKTDAKLFREERKILAQLKPVAPAPTPAPTATPVPERKMKIEAVLNTPPPLVRAESPVLCEPEVGWETVAKPVRKPASPPQHDRPTRLCQSVLNRVPCKYGRKCHFAHRVEDLQPVYCKFDRCKYSKEIRPGVYNGTCDRWHQGETCESYAARMLGTPSARAPWSH